MRSANHHCNTCTPLVRDMYGSCRHDLRIEHNGFTSFYDDLPIKTMPIPFKDLLDLSSTSISASNQHYCIRQLNLDPRKSGAGRMSLGCLHEISVRAARTDPNANKLAGQLYSTARNSAVVMLLSFFLLCTPLSGLFPRN